MFKIYYIIGLLLLLLIDIRAQDTTYFMNYTGDDLDSAITLFSDPGSNVLYVSSKVFANGYNRFNNITSAIAAWSSGKVIILAGELFNEDVLIPLEDSTMVIKGISKYASRINSLYVVGRNTKIENLTVEKRFEFRCGHTYDGWHEGNIFRNIIFRGSVYVGTPTINALNRSTFENCDLIGVDSTIYCKNSTGGRFHGGFVNRYNVTIEKGYLSFYAPREVFFKKIRLGNSAGYSVMTIRYCESVNFGDSVYSDNSMSNYAVFSMNNCKAYSRGSWGAPMNDLWIWGMYEFDVFDCLWNMPATVRWYATVPSRIVNLTQTWWNSSTVFSGSAIGLSNLHVFNSIFSAEQPAGLGTDQNNSWRAFIDN